DRDWTKAGDSSYIPTGTLDGKAQNANGEWVARGPGYDFTQDSWYQTPSKRYSVFANATQDLGNDLVFTADALFTKRKSDQQLAAQPGLVMLDVCGEPGADAANCLTLSDA